MNKSFLLALPLLAAAPLLAQNGAPQLPGQADASRVAAGTYTVDNHHAQIQWTVNHFGFNDYFGIFGQPTGSLTIDPAKPNDAKVSVTIPVTELATSRADLTKHMLTPDFLDAAKFPTATFESTKVVATGNTAKITGNLTLLGVTKPVTLDATFTGAGTNPMTKKATVGFHGTTTLKRSDFGMTKFVPFVSDEVKIAISIAFEK
ncbi:polyisoprenoid-binding protein [Chakrabartia godavariana]|nr:polyisoprenoid-binding protein [Chakrabartia godavariana]